MIDFIDQIPPLINLVIGFVLGGIVFFISTFHKAKKNGAYEKEKQIFYQSAKGGEYIHKNNHKEKLRIEYLKGIERGKEDERKKLTINLKPYLQIDDGVFSKTLYRGYLEQVFYDGFPIGEPRYQQLEIVEKFKQENYEKILDKTLLTLESIIDRYASRLLNAFINSDNIEEIDN